MAIVLPFRDLLIAASLKLHSGLTCCHAFRSLPRSIDRGLIEATRANIAAAPHRCPFRDLLIAASLKLRTPRPTDPACSAAFRDLLIAASLKRVRRGA